MKVLIIEDGELTLAQTKRMLSDVGFTEMMICNSGYLALDYAKIYKPDLVVMDYSLREKMNGIEMSAEIKRLLDIPVIFLSAVAEPVTEDVKQPVAKVKKVKRTKQKFLNKAAIAKLIGTIHLN